MFCENKEEDYFLCTISDWHSFKICVYNVHGSKFDLLQHRGWVCAQGRGRGDLQGHSDSSQDGEEAGRACQNHPPGTRCLPWEMGLHPRSGSSLGASSSERANPPALNDNSNDFIIMLPAALTEVLYIVEPLHWNHNYSLLCTLLANAEWKLVFLVCFFFSIFWGVFFGRILQPVIYINPVLVLL